MADKAWETTFQIWVAIEKHQGSVGDGKALRLIKLSEEVGEVAQAYIGYRGANKRKGTTHAHADIACELVDVIITAMVALEDWTYDPEGIFQERLAVIRGRVQEQGS